MTRMTAAGPQIAFGESLLARTVRMAKKLAEALGYDVPRYLIAGASGVDPESSPNREAVSR